MMRSSCLSKILHQPHLHLSNGLMHRLVFPVLYLIFPHRSIFHFLHSLKITAAIPDRLSTSFTSLLFFTPDELMIFDDHFQCSHHCFQQSCVKVFHWLLSCSTRLSKASGALSASRSVEAFIFHFSFLSSKIMKSITLYLYRFILCLSFYRGNDICFIRSVRLYA